MFAMKRTMFAMFVAAMMVVLMAQSTFALSSGVGGINCTRCHSGAETPTVTISGPAEIKPGQTGLYQLIIEGGPAAAGGMNVLVGNGQLAAVDASTKIQGTALTHAAAKSPETDGSILFEFEWTAPIVEGAVTFSGFGNSVNLNGTPTGDGVGNVKPFVVNVTSNPTAVSTSSIASVTPSVLPFAGGLFVVGCLTAAYTRKNS